MLCLLLHGSEQSHEMHAGVPQSTRFSFETTVVHSVQLRTTPRSTGAVDVTVDELEVVSSLGLEGPVDPEVSSSSSLARKASTASIMVCSFPKDSEKPSRPLTAFAIPVKATEKSSSSFIFLIRLFTSVVMFWT